MDVIGKVVSQVGQVHPVGSDNRQIATIPL